MPGRAASGRSSTSSASSPELRERVPATDVERWVALFAHAHALKPADVANVPLTPAQQATLDLANEATFSDAELEAYRKARDEVQQTIQYGKDGEARGEARGARRKQREVLLRLIRARGFVLDEAQRAQIEACQDNATLDAWIDRALVATELDVVFSAAWV